ncbi:MAG: aldehyde dehydrogenase family protein [Hyphomicrobiaceae bacterium]|jgi:acyl-CoA reductase-like NAD-dependent aldehyde dehydrogenase
MGEIVCISPIDGTVVDRRATATQGPVQKAFNAAWKARREWAHVPFGERAALMLRFLEAMRAMNGEVVPELARQMGRPVRYGGEIKSFAERVEYMVGIAESALAPVAPEAKPGFRRIIRRESLGVVLVIAPWNYPYLTAVNTIVPALMAGNVVLLKAASQTILAGDRFQLAMDRAGVPKGVFQHIVLDHRGTERIISNGLADHVAFTGSVEGGRAIERAAAGTFTSVGLELGGKDPAYVCADVNLDFAIENTVDGAFFNSGQSCCGIERIYVHESVYDRFVDGFVALARQYVLDDPLDERTTLGPMAQTRFAEAVRKQTAEAVAKGASALIDPKAYKRAKTGTPWLEPQVLTGVDHTMSVMTEESFGPVVGIMKVRDDDEAISLMNDSRYGLTASVWTQDLDAAERIGSWIETGTVYANRCDYLDPGLAWTGVKDTGRGASLSRTGYEALTRPKSFHLRETS